MAIINFSIQKIEPPFWWADLKWHQLQLMVYGKNLAEIEVTCSSDQLKITKIHQLENTNHSFVDISISPNAKPQIYQIIFQKKEHQLIVPFEIKKRTTHLHGHAGFDHNDIVYLIMPDRFAQAGKIVDDLGSDWESVDRKKPEARHGGPP